MRESQCQTRGRQGHKRKTSLLGDEVYEDTKMKIINTKITEDGMEKEKERSQIKECERTGKILTIPSDINGLLKSMIFSRSEVIVIGAIAMSASCKEKIIPIKDGMRTVISHTDR